MNITPNSQIELIGVLTISFPASIKIKEENKAKITKKVPKKKLKSLFILYNLILGIFIFVKKIILLLIANSA